MKKIILILVCMCVSYNMYAQGQTRDFAYFNRQIDSLALQASVDTLRRIYGVSFWQSNLTDKEKKKLINKARKMFEQQEYSNLYHLGHRIISDIWYVRPYKNSIEIKQILLELYLQFYFYPYRENNILEWHYHDLNMKNNYTPKAKKRIVEILEGKKTQKEYDIWLQYYNSFPDEFNSTKKDAIRLMKRREIQNDEVLKQIYDSLRNEYAKEHSKRYFEALQIEPDLIKIIGFLDMKECVPILQKHLQEGLDNNNIGEPERSYRFALAKLGDAIQRQYVLDNHMDIEEFDGNLFAYFRDDEMMWKYIEVNYSSGKIIHNGSESSYPASYATMDNVYPFIKNLPEELVSPRFPTMNGYYQWAKLLYEWLMGNKDKVEFDYNIER